MLTIPHVLRRDKNRGSAAFGAHTKAGNSVWLEGFLFNLRSRCEHRAWAVSPSATSGGVTLKLIAPYLTLKAFANFSVIPEFVIAFQRFNTTTLVKLRRRRVNFSLHWQPVGNEIRYSASAGWSVVANTELT